MNNLTWAEAAAANIIETLPADVHQALMDYLDNNERHA